MVPYYNKMLLCVKAVFLYVVDPVSPPDRCQLLVFSREIGRSPQAALIFILKIRALSDGERSWNMLCRKSLDTQYIV
jgi:hypothetical protein